MRLDGKYSILHENIHQLIYDKQFLIHAVHLEIDQQNQVYNDKYILQLCPHTKHQVNNEYVFDLEHIH